MSLSGADVSGTLKSEKEHRICDKKAIVTVKGMIQVKLEIKEVRDGQDSVGARLPKVCHGAVSGSGGGSKMSCSTIKHN